MPDIGGRVEKKVSLSAQSIGSHVGSAERMGVTSGADDSSHRSILAYNIPSSGFIRTRFQNICINSAVAWNTQSMRNRWAPRRKGPIKFDHILKVFLLA